MSRRTAAGLLAVALAAALGAVIVLTPVHYVTFRPGPTINVLGDYDGKPILVVSGHKAYRDKGGLRMVTVYAGGPDEQVNLFGMLEGWVDPDVAVLPSSIYRKDETAKTVREESAQQMASSQDSATAAALSAAGIGYHRIVTVKDVDAKGASAGILRKGDVVLAVAGKPVDGGDDVVARVRAIRPGTPTDVRVRRDGVERTVRVTTRPATDDPKASRLGVTIDTDFDFPFPVKVQLPDTIGGPSAGLFFALGIYDLLTPGSLTAGKQVAGSGEIAPDGTVAPIGGVGQKVVAAQRDGAKLFLVAQENCAEAVHAHYDPKRIRLVKVHTLKDAIGALDTWREDPKAALPRCPS